MPKLLEILCYFGHVLEAPSTRRRSSGCVVKTDRVEDMIIHDIRVPKHSNTLLASTQSDLKDLLREKLASLALPASTWARRESKDSAESEARGHLGLCAAQTFPKHRAKSQTNLTLNPKSRTLLTLSLG